MALLVDQASLRLGRLVALLRAANGLVQEYTANADANANAEEQPQGRSD